MARPTDWSPLAKADPVPGEPDGIRDEVTHMKKIAKKLRDQAAAMQAIADSDGLKGKYADKIGEKARGLSKRLDLAEDRYREVKGHLDDWADDMETAQKKADRALQDAKDAQRTLDAHKTDDTKGGTKKDSDKGGASEDPAVKRAEEDLEEARRKLNSAVSFYDERADHYASKIRSSIDDDMEDSWWNDFKAWVGDADWLDGLAEALSWIATGLSVLAIFFPAFGVVALALTGAVALIHLTQALTGNGSWFDVLMDIGALKMARNGIKAAKAIKGLQKGAREVAEGLAKKQARQEAQRASSAARRAGGKAGRLHRTADFQKAKSAARQVKQAELPQPTLRESASAFGDKAIIKQVKDIRLWRDQFPTSVTLNEGAASAGKHLSAYQGSWIVGTGLDAGDKLAGELPWTSDEYDRTKARISAPVGSQW
ncbi:putative T7SS-secreted protein [Streptomyces sp. NPDC056373]|uniref:putative T7SS-secreted protein n=1 Tax=Streptomyces sp. NPDC056373 TaxID=3345798 RepID=UPI0035DD6E0E